MKKIMMSAAAAALMGTAAYAGTLTYGTGKAKLIVAEELFDLGDYNATLATNDANLTYTAAVDPAQFGGSISDPLINLSFSSSVSLANSAVFALVDKDNVLMAYQADDPVDNVYRLRGTSQTAINNNVQYRIVTATGLNANDVGEDISNNISNDAYFAGGINDFKNATATLELWSTSGTPTRVDSADISLYDVAPQYFVSCENKFNKLINVESASFTFVATKHGVLKTLDGTEGDIMDVLSSVMKLRVKKETVDFGLDGNTTNLAITTESNLTNVVLAANTGSDFGKQGDFSAAVNDITVSPEAYYNSTGVFELNITDKTTNDGFEGNTSSDSLFTVRLNVPGDVQIPETKFYANMYINYRDYNTTVTPKGSYTPNAFIGEWKNFAYIAQIAGATQTAVTQTKLFITNRGCKTVTPELKFILDGKVVTVTLSEIPVDTQKKYLLGDVINANSALFAAAGMPTEGQYSVEITIPGNAEDFYVYAQAQSKTDISATKDLPVYNTSTRD